MAGSGTAHLRPDDDVVLRADHLVVEFPVGHTGLKVHAVSDVSLDVLPGETLGLVGESGCGKSTTGRALMQLPRPNSGNVRFGDRELTTMPGPELRRTRPQMQMIFQDPISSLNPRRRVRDIVAEPLSIWAAETHPPSTPVQIARGALLGDAALRAGAFVALLVLWFLNSGIGGLTGFSFSLLPDVDRWFRAEGTLLLFSAMIFGAASAALAAAVRDRMRGARVALGIETALSWLWALTLLRSGFSSAGIVFGIGSVLLLVATVGALAARADFARMAGVRAEHDRIVRRVLEDVGIDPDVALLRRPHEFSGGQCQRICIARALVLDPKVLICDEPVSALDVSVQAQILNLLEDMKARYGLTMVFIAHDLAVVKNISDRVAVMYLGKLCEVAPPDVLYAQPAHPYSVALLASIPVPDPRHRPSTATVSGEIPSPVSPPSGCRFRTRCPRAQESCASLEPEMREVAPGQFVACHFPLIGPHLSVTGPPAADHAWA